METNLTRRRVIQGTGALGIASIVGSSVVSAQQDGSGAALRVAHASPDAPQVDVRVDDQTPIEGLGFRDVSSYNEVEPGTHQVQVVVTDEGILGGVLDDLFGDDDDEEAVIFDQEIEVQEGTAYTAVAFGEVSQGSIPAGDGDGLGDNESDGGLGDDETDGGLGDNESDGGLGEDDGDGADGGPGQQLVESLSFGEHETVELDAGGYTLEVEESTAAGTGDGATGDGLGEDDDGLGDNETDGGLGEDDGGLGDNETGDGIGDNETGDGIGDNETDGGLGDNETDGGLGDNESDGVATDGGTGDGLGDNETGDGLGDNESDGGLGEDDDGLGEDDGGADTGFQVEILEDEITDPGDERAQVRIFHAVPDVDSVTISAVSDEAVGGDGLGDNESDGGLGDNESDGDLGDNESDGGLGDDETGDGIDDNESDGGLGDDETGDGIDDNESDGGLGDGGVGGQQDESVRQASVSFEGNSAYSGFAVGYFDPQSAPSPGDGDGIGDNETDGGLGDNETDGGIDDNESDGGLGDNETGDGIGDNETGDGIGDDGADDGLGDNETDDGGEDGEGVAEDAEGEEFEIVTVRDAQDGERADGGTGGLL